MKCPLYTLKIGRIPMSEMIRQTQHLRLWLSCLALSFPLIACDDEGGGDEGGAGPVRAGEMAGAEAGVEGGLSAGVMGGMSGEEAGVEGGAGGTGGTGGMSGVRVITSCEELCGVYEGCGTAPSPWGESCLEGCMGQDWEDPSFRSYVACLKGEPCETLDACRIPPPPLPSCEEACALTDSCEADFRLPTALTQMGTCGGACQDPTWARQISSCVQDNSLNLCDAEPVFARCLLEDRGPDCLSLCDALAGCDESVDAIDCAIECLMEAPEEDPLAELHRQEQRACVIAAGSCDEVEGCVTPAAPPIADSVTRACDAGEACGVIAEGACPEAMASVAGGLSAAGVSCLAERLEASCDEPLIACFEQGFTPNEGVCSDYCRAAAVCDQLPEGQVEFDCIEGCNAAINGQDPTALAAYQGRFTCAEANSCAAFSDCVALGGGVSGCAEHCAARAACGDSDEAACLARCESTPNTERVRIERACAAVLSCEAQEALCELPPAPNCAALCEPLSACGLAGESCELRCDNEHLSDPEPFLPLLACVSATERCDERAACEDDSSRGSACLAYCEHQLSCEGAEGALESCVVSCGRGELSGAELNRFAAARDCLATQVGGSCEALSSCLDDGELSGLCAEVCATASACGFEQGAEGCVSACEAAPEAFEGLACVSLSDSRAGGCAGAAACLGVEAPVPTPACEALCARQRECDPSTDLFLCHAQCIESDEGDLARATCAQIASCEDLEACLGAEPSPSAACVAACGELGVSCPAQAELEGCEERCAGVSLALGESAEEPFAECLSAAMCDEEALNRCFSGQLAGPSEELCQRSWIAVNACNMGLGGFLPIGDEATFMMDCAAEYAMDPAATIAQVECLEESLAVDPSCFSALSCGF